MSVPIQKVKIGLLDCVSPLGAKLIIGFADIVGKFPFLHRYTLDAFVGMCVTLTLAAVGLSWPHRTVSGVV